MKLRGPLRIWLFCALIAWTTSAFLPPLITEWHEDKSIVEGATVTFACKANGDPKPRMMWRKDGVEITDTNILKDGGIEIRNVTAADAGVYACRAESTLGYTEKSANLIIRGHTRITDSPQDSIVVVGNNAIFHCNATTGSSTRLTLEWLHNGEPIDFNAATRLVHHPNNSLTIAHVQLPDNGTYICLAKTEEDEATAEGHLNVAERIVVEVEPQELTIISGSPVSLHCRATSKFPLLVTVKWLHNGENMNFSHNSRFSLASNNTLTITNARSEDLGTFTCLATTVVDEVAADVQVMVIDVPNPPRIRSVTCSPHQAVIKWESVGDNNSPILGYQAMYQSSNSPKVWLSFAENMPASANTTTFVMTELWASYRFVIIAKNAVGHSYPSSISKACETESDIPHKNPHGVTGKGGHNDTLVINWDIMYMHEHHGPGFKYRVYWRRDAPVVNWKATNIIDWEKTEYIVRNETKFERYRIKVAAVNDLGAAKVLPVEIFAYLGEDVPTESPANLIATEIVNATHALVSWDPVPPASVHGQLLGYKIQIWTDESDKEGKREIVVVHSTTNMLVSNLFPYSKNYVHVLAYNSEHDGPPSNVLIINTPEGIPEVVHQFDANAMGSTSFYLKWEPPTKVNGELTGYKMTYAPSLTPTSTTDLLITYPMQEQMKINGLNPNTEYQFSIAALTRTGEGVAAKIFSSTRSNTTAEPDTPRFEWYQQPVVNSAARIKVVWKPNVLGNIGSHFYVKYREKGEKKIYKTPPEFTDLSLVIQGLTIAKVYDFKIVAVDGDHKVESSAQDVDTYAFLRVPKFLSRFQPLKLGENEHNLSLKCVANGNQPLTIHWAVDGVPILNNSRFTTEQYFTSDGDVASYLNITNMDVSEGGEFSCTADDQGSKITHRARVDLKGNPFIKPMPVINTYAGNDVVLTCPVTGYPVESIIWKKGGERLFGNQRRTVYHNGTMILRSINSMEAGTYKCIVSTRSGIIVTRDVDILVLEID